MDLYPVLRPLLFGLPAEMAHHLSLTMASGLPALGRVWGPPPSARLATALPGAVWRSPFGLAAGLDKNAVALDFFSRLPVGSLECGTITPLPQEGNPKPRVFRYPEEQSLRNAMGFPNEGMEACAARLGHRPANFPVGINIGKSKNANPAQAIDEYRQLYERLAPLGDWIVVNISSPNTPGLRDLQQEAWLKELFTALAPLRSRLGKPLYVKLSPDLGDEDLRALTRVLADLGADGLVATNTTHVSARGPGGMSGRALRVKGHHKRRTVLEVARDRQLPVVGVGGFESMTDVLAWWAGGGTALQLYTALVYQGPGLLRRLEDETLAFLVRASLPDVGSFFAQTPPERQKLIAAFAQPR